MGEGRGDQSNDHTDILRIQSVYLDVREKFGRGGIITITSVNTKALGFDKNYNLCSLARSFKPAWQ